MGENLKDLKDLNLVPKSYYQKKKDKKKKIIKRFLIYLGIIAFAGAFAFPFVIENNLNKEVMKLRTQQHDTSGASGMRIQLNEINRLVKDRETEAGKINNVVVGFKLSTIIEKIEVSKPEKLFLVNTSYTADIIDEKSISLSGIALGEYDISKFIINLKKSNLFKNITLKGLTKLDNGSCSYTIIAQIAGG